MQIFYSDPFGKITDLVKDGLRWAGKVVSIKQEFRVLNPGEDFPPGTLKITVKAPKFMKTQTIKVFGFTAKKIHEGFWVQP